MDTRPISSDIVDQSAWARALGDELFTGANAGAPLYLFLEADVLAGISSRLGIVGDAAGALARSVRDHIYWHGTGRPFGRWDAETALWEAGGKVGTPPYLSLLAVLTCAAELMVSDGTHAAHNYYDRLRELLGIPPEEFEAVRRHFGQTVRFWKSLNDWLEDWDGEQGWPTAKVRDRRTLIGYPLSQALVRRQDRRALQIAFDEYGLAPGRRTSVSEMTEYLSDWIERGGAPKGITRLWADATAKTRITQIACDELLHWKGEVARGPSSAQGQGSNSVRLIWLAELALSPIPKIELYLITKQDPLSVVGGYRVEETRTNAAGISALQDCGDDLRFEHLPAIGWASLEPWSRVGLTSLLSGAIELESVDAQRRSLMRSPEPLVVLMQEDNESRYSEVRRVQLLEPSMVLAEETSAANVEQHLRTHARDGWRRFDHHELRNLPRGWLLYVDVMMIKSADDSVAGKLAPLCAAPATMITLAGGVKLGQSTWHAARRPEILASVDNEGPFGIAIVDRGGLPQNLHFSQYVGRAVMSLDGLGLEDGDYEVQLIRATAQGESKIAQVLGFRLRTADHPRPLGVRETLDGAHDLSSGLGLVGIAHGTMPAALRGCELPPQLIGRTLPSGPPLGIAGKPEKSGALFRRVTRIDDSRFSQSCAIRGYHYWICDPGEIGDNYRTLKRQVCRTCHREEWTRNRGVKQRRFHQARRRMANRAALSNVPRYRRLHTTPSEAYDLLLDALSFIGVGSWDRLRNLAASLGTEDGFAWRAARLFSAFGHIDLRFDARIGRYSGWQVAPACLVEAVDGTWVLAGARSDRFLRELETRIALQGGEARREPTESGPAVFRARFPAGSGLVDLSAIQSPLGVPVSYARAFARRLVTALPPLSEILPHLPELEVGPGEHECFDLLQGEWTPVSEIGAGGAYRVDYRGLNYGYRASGDPAAHRIRVGDAHLIKHLAAAGARISLLEHDRRNGALLVPLGANLPGLYERVAVMCSGIAPRFRADNGCMEYAGVPSDVAMRLQQALHA